MFLDTVNTDLLQATQAASPLAAEPYAAWQHFPYSRILHHRTACCETAREWLLAMDFSLLSGGSMRVGPRWLRTQYDWGPSMHPMHWCEAVKQKALDCGVLAAMANECFLARGLQSFPAQLIQRYSKESTAHWTDKWKQAGASVHWIKGDIIYHEGCAVLAPDNSIRLWDASAAWWINRLQKSGYGSLAAIRIFAPDAAPGAGFRWGKLNILPGQWHTI